jgi:hypothetical protein
LLEQGQTVASYAVFEQQRTEAGAREGTRHGMALQLAGQVDARKQLEASLEVEAAHRQKAEAAMQETAARAWAAEQQKPRWRASGDSSSSLASACRALLL